MQIELRIDPVRKLRHEEIPRLDPAEVDRTEAHPVVLILDNIRSAHNVGSIMRSADAALIREVIVTGITPLPDHRGARKTALGAEETVTWRHVPDSVDTVSSLRREGYTIAVLELTDTPSTSADLEAESFPICLIAGNEVDGVSDELVEMADLALEIPQFGAKQSLNVSVAVGIALFDLVRRYRSMKSRVHS